MELNDEGVELVAELLGLPKEKVLEIVPADDAPTQFKALGTAAIKKARDEGHQKGTGQTSKTLLAAIKAEFDVELTGSTPAEIAKSLKEAVAEQGSEGMSEEAIKASDTYKELQAEAARKEAKKQKDIEKGIKEGIKQQEEVFKKELKAVKKSGYLTEIEIAAGEYAEKEGLVLSSDPDTRRRQIKALIKEGLSDFDVDKDEDGDFILTKDGQPATKDGRSMTIEDAFRSGDYLFNKQTVKQRESSALDPKNPGGGPKGEFKHFKGEVPKDEVEMNALRVKLNYREISREALEEAESAYKASKSA